MATGRILSKLLIIDGLTVMPMKVLRNDVSRPRRLLKLSDHQPSVSSMGFRTSSLLDSNKPQPPKPTVSSKEKKKGSILEEAVHLLDADGNFIADKPMSEAIAFAAQHHMTLQKEEHFSNHQLKITPYKMVPISKLAEGVKQHSEPTKKSTWKKVTEDRPETDDEGDDSKVPHWRREKISDKSTDRRVVKVLSIRSKVASNDITIKTRQISKWIAEGCEVRVTVSGFNATNDQLEDLFNSITKPITGNSRILQKVIKDNILKFQVHPLKLKSPDSPESHSHGHDQNKEKEEEELEKKSERSETDVELDDELRRQLKELEGKK